MSREVFNAIADIAAVNHYRAKHHLWRCVSKMTDMAILEIVRHPRNYSSFIRPFTFRNPTGHARGYYSLLKFIASFENGIKRKDILEHYSLKSMSLQLDNLEYAGLIALDRSEHACTHKFTVTSFGKAYLAAAEFNA